MIVSVFLMFFLFSCKENKTEIIEKEIYKVFAISEHCLPLVKTIISNSAARTSEHYSVFDIDKNLNKDSDVTMVVVVYGGESYTASSLNLEIELRNSFEDCDTTSYIPFEKSKDGWTKLSEEIAFYENLGISIHSITFTNKEYILNLNGREIQNMKPSKEG